MSRAFSGAMPKPQEVDRWLDIGSDVVVRLMGGVALGGGIVALFASGFLVVLGAAVGGLLGVASRTPKSFAALAERAARTILKK